MSGVKVKNVRISTSIICDTAKIAVALIHDRLNAIINNGVLAFETSKIGNILLTLRANFNNSL